MLQLNIHECCVIKRCDGLSETSGWDEGMKYYIHVCVASIVSYCLKTNDFTGLCRDHTAPAGGPFTGPMLQ